MFQLASFSVEKQIQMIEYGLNYLIYTLWYDFSDDLGQIFVTKKSGQLEHSYLKYALA